MNAPTAGDFLQNPIIEEIHILPEAGIKNQNSKRIVAKGVYINWFKDIEDYIREDTFIKELKELILMELNQLVRNDIYLIEITLIGSLLNPESYFEVKFYQKKEKDVGGESGIVLGPETDLYEYNIYRTREIPFPRKNFMYGDQGIGAISHKITNNVTTQLG